MRIGSVPDPQGWDRWEEAKAFLEPAFDRSDFDRLIEPGEALWAVMDGDDLLACATARLTEDGACEVLLVGGRERKRWLAELDRTIGAAGREAGATRMLAMGRRGWLRELSALGWERMGESGGSTVYSRELGAK